MDRIIKDLCASMGKKVEEQENFCEECADLEAELDAEQFEHENDLKTLYSKREVAAIVIEAVRVATGSEKLRGAARNKLLLQLERDLPDKGVIRA